MTEERRPPNFTELGNIAQRAHDQARKPGGREEDCPYGDDAPQRRAKWLREFRRWRAFYFGDNRK